MEIYYTFMRKLYVLGTGFTNFSAQVWVIFLEFICCLQFSPSVNKMFTSVYKIREPNTDPRTF